MKISFMGILQLIFITLKLLDKINWSWFLVLLPLEIPTLLYFICVLVLILIED